MPLTLVQLLAARGLAQVDLQAAEARRVKRGGGLETSLLELGALDEARIGELWAEASRLPRPPPELLKDVTAAMASLFPQQLAERYGMVPLGLVRRQLSLLARHPVDLSTVDEISFLLSRPLKLFIGTELEIAELLGVVYGVAVPQRLKELRFKLTPSSGAPAPPVAPASSVAPAPVPADLAPPSRPADVAPAPEVAPAPLPADVAPNPDVAPASLVAPAPVPGDVAPAEDAPEEPSPPPDDEVVSIESALASMSAQPQEAEPAPPDLAPSAFAWLPEPWSISLPPLREPASASSRARAAGSPRISTARAVRPSSAGPLGSAGVPAGGNSTGAPGSAGPCAGGRSALVSTGASHAARIRPAPAVVPEPPRAEPSSRNPPSHLRPSRLPSRRHP